MAQTTPLGLTVIPPGGDLSANGYGLTSRDPVLVDRLLRSLMGHRHNGGVPTVEESPDPPTLANLDEVGGLLPDTTYYYRISEMRGGGLVPFESPASTSTWVHTPAGLTAPVITDDDVTVSTMGGGLAPGFYQYAVTVYDTFYTLDTNCPSPVSVMLAPLDGDEQEISISLPSLPTGADGWNIYRRVPNGLTFQLLETLVGEQVSPFVDDGSIIEDSRVLPTRNLSAWKRSVTVTRPPGVTGDWVVYRSRDDSNWAGSRIAVVDSAEDSIPDTGLPSDFLTPQDSFSAYWEPGRVRGDEIVETAQVLRFFRPGAAATGVMPGGEWVCPFAEARLVGVGAHLAVGTTPTSQDLLYTVQQWDGSAWDDVFSGVIESDASGGDAVVDPPVEFAQGDRVRVNVSQVGSGGDVDLAVNLNIWAHPGWTAVTWNEP